VRIVDIGPDELKCWDSALNACLSILDAYTVNIETDIPTRVSEIIEEATRRPAMATAQLKHGGFAPEVAEQREIRQILPHPAVIVTDGVARS
jgi:hypothetical protein